ncbi:glycoside hydrolase family 127 protein [Mucilaginibacter puniceus]
MKQQIKIFFTTILCLLLGFNSFGQTALNSQVIKVLPFNNTEVALASSWIKNREDLNIKYIKSLDADRMLHNFKVTAGITSTAKPLEGWEAPSIGIRGHFVGHYLSAVSVLVEKYKDPELAQRLNYMISELHKCQQALGNGYLSAFSVKEFQTLETRFGGVWAPYYAYHKIMQGLLDAYIHTGNKEAYEIVTGMASFVDMRISKLSTESIEKMLYTVEANPGNEAGAMNEVLYKLYEVSNNPKHLALAKVFDRDWFVVPLSKNIDILNGLHSNTHLVLVNGFAERYTITKEKKYHDAAVNFWNMLISKHAYANGSSSGPRPNVTTKTSQTAEHWGIPGVLSNTLSKEIAESCVTHNTQKLTAKLFTWSPDARFAEQYMNTLYNAVLPSQSDSTGQSVYHLPLGSPQSKQFLKDNDFRCCNGTCIEGFAALNTGIYYHNHGDMWVNLYIPSKLTWAEKGLSLQQTGDITEGKAVEFKISNTKSSKMAINFFIPSWATDVNVFVNGTKQQGKSTPMSYYTLRRAWKNNDVIKLVFNYGYHIKTMPDDKNTFAIFYGPTLLAFETKNELTFKQSLSTSKTQGEILSKLNYAGNGNFNLTYAGQKYLLHPLYNINKQSYGVYSTIRDY